MLCCSPTDVVLVNDTLTGDPLMTVPILTDMDVQSYSDVSSLCYEIHGEAGRVFNLITDECTTVNALYEQAQTPSSNIDLNVVTSIGVRAVGTSGTCYNIKVDMESCQATIDGKLTPLNHVSDGVTVRRAGNGSRVRIAVPNCADTRLVMWVFCLGGRVEDHVTEVYYNIQFIRFVVMRGLNLDERSHGLIGKSIDLL